MSSLPPPSAIDKFSFKIALELYPSVAEKVYKSKLKDVKKFGDALERDKWRFEELPLSVAASRAKKPDKAGKPQPNASLSKETVERLVQWKITHGQSRPFLPAMVRKNDASAVEKQTSNAFEKLENSSSNSAPSVPTLVAALDSVCKLTGIGPATGTLLLNIFDPQHIPFFQDEMFSWFFPDLRDTKLKYTQKEYLQLYDAVAPVLQKLGVHAIELEKVAYILWHKDLLEVAELSRLEQALSGHTSDIVEAPKAMKLQSGPKPSADSIKTAKGTKRRAETANDASTKRQTRRTRS